MSALPTLGGNNAQATAINNRGQITGFAENGTVDSSCSANATNTRIQLPVIWEDGKARPLRTVGTDKDGVANAINDQGQAVGSSGNCAGGLHAVLWDKNGTARDLEPAGAAAFGINNQGQIVGLVPSLDGSTFSAALWQNGAIKNLGTLGDHAAIASGINDKGQVVGSTLDSNFNFDAHAFIYQDGVMTDLSKLFPEESNLFPTMANQINDRGQIVGMATVVSGPHEGETHAFLATPVDERMVKSIADVAPGHPKSNLPANAGKQLLQRLGRGRFEQ
jgi:probable HAF family extracellular repeat protein